MNDKQRVHYVHILLNYFYSDLTTYTMNAKILVVTLALLVMSGCAHTTAPAEEQGTVADNTIDLSNTNLSRIPDDTFDKTNTQVLNVSGNDITGSIQAEIRHLTNLTVINASNNAMAGVPAEIGQLSKLEVLDLSNNQLTGLPNEIGNLKNLKTFNISGNNYVEQDLQGIIDNLPSSVEVIR